MSDVEQPLDRLNYYNGQRLEAADFRLEQEFHIRVRRWLNKSLYTWGIAAGLEVTVKEGDPHKVVVSPGMALDIDGREIILLEAREVQVVGKPSLTEGVVSGNYLVIQYYEEKVAPIADGCAVPLKDKSGSKIAWGGPSRIRSEPLISFQNDWPYKEGGQKIVLAQVELDEACAVRHIHTSVRKYAGAAQPGKALAYALEGEKDIDAANSKKIYFHIRGGRPNAVTLYLRGEKFSTLYYTELGRHTHGHDTLRVEAHDAIKGHSHPLGNLTTSFVDPPVHIATANLDEEDPEDNAIYTEDAGKTDSNLANWINMKISHEKGHEHTILAGETTDLDGAIKAQPHTFTGSLGETGIALMFPAIVRTSGSPHTYVKRLQIWLDGQEYTTIIEERLGWQQIHIGDGTSTHLLVQTGTGPIQLELLGADLNEGEHVIELKVAGSGNGGRILYNIYVE